MTRVLLVHWRDAEGRERARELRAAGLWVEYEADAQAMLRGAKDDPPDAIVIDLTRLPSHGREVAWALRQSKKTRGVPLVFAGGEAAKVARLQRELPDASFVAWPVAPRAIERAIAHAPREPVVPERKHFYTAKPLAAKLGAKAGTRLALVDAPPGFEATLGELPSGALVQHALRGKCEIAVWFVRSAKEMKQALPKWVKFAERGGRVWVAWPKKGSRFAGDLTEKLVRSAPHARGLVDFKICAIDDDWSGMCFAKRKGIASRR